MFRRLIPRLGVSAAGAAAAPLNGASMASATQRIILREATQSEFDVVVAFEQDLAMETEGKRIDDMCLARGVRGPLERPHLARFLLGHLPGQSDPVGYVALMKQWCEWRGAFMHYILSAHVSKSARRIGAFKQMFQSVQSIAANDHLSCGIRLNVERANERAQIAYQRLGMHIEDYDMYAWYKSPDQFPGRLNPELPTLNPDVPTQFPNGKPWTLRLATAADLPSLVELHRQNARETLKLEPLESDIRRGVAVPWAEPHVARIYVAEQDSKIVGMTMVTNEWNTWKGGVIYWLTSGYVLPNYRKHGVFSSLLGFAKDAVKRESNAAGIRMHARLDNKLAPRLAEKFEMKKEPYYLMRWESPTPPGCAKAVTVSLPSSPQ
jgi:ribosomal protein S18 acetylase RimI-like enzyme